jgi:hypothetical protein
MEDVYIKEIIENYYNTVLSMDINLKRLSIEDKYKEKNKTTTIMKAYFNNEEFKFKLVEMKTYSIVIESFIDIERIFKFKNNKLDNLSNFGIQMYNKRKKKKLQYCHYSKGKLHKLDSPAVESPLLRQYWVNGVNFTEEKALEFFQLKNKIKGF